MEESNADVNLIGNENHRCNRCGEEYEQALFTENSSGAVPEDYYACPRCLSKVAAVERQQLEVEEESVTKEPPEETISSEIEKTEARSGCLHQLGYLKKRDRNSPIPDECLICTKMIDCM